MAKLRIGIDGEALRAPLSGVGNYVFNLCRELDTLMPEATFIVYSRSKVSDIRLPASRWVLRSESSPVFRALPSFVWLKTRGRGMAAADRLDIFWAGRTIHPGLSKVRTVSTIHDLNHLVVPQTMQFQTRVSHELWFRRDTLSADCVLANSYGTAERIRAYLGVTVGGIIQPGVGAWYRPPNNQDRRDGQEELSRLGVKQPYLLSVATAEPRKNLNTVLDAYLALKANGKLPGYCLILAGSAGWKNKSLAQKIAAAESDGIVQTGYVPDALMPMLYAEAEALIFPSIYEGFGMPVLEARACGTKVVISDIPELREAGGPNAIIVEPTLEGVMQGIERVIDTPISEALNMVDSSSWRRSGEQLAEVFLNI